MEGVALSFALSFFCFSQRAVELAHQLLELADLPKNIPAESRVPWHSQLHRLPWILMLLAVIDAAG
jgi:hypothetical protein